MNTPRSVLVLAPLSSGARFEVGPDESPPPNTINTRGMRLYWRVTTDSHENAAVNGKSLRDLQGWVYVYRGASSPEGQVRYNDDARIGVMSHPDKPGTHYSIGLCATPELFQHLLEMCRLGRLPHVSLDLGVFADELSEQTKLDDLGSSSLLWNTKQFRRLEVRWFSFQWPLHALSGGGPDELVEAQPVSAKAFASGVDKLHDAIKKATAATWIACGLLALLLFT